VITLAFIVFELLKRIEANSTTLYDSRVRSKSGRLQKFFQEGNVEILLIFFRLVMMQCKWTFTKRFTLSTPLVCAG